MPLPAGERLDKDRHPIVSWPPIPPHPRDALSRGQGRSREARVAKDGTRWCAYCDNTVDPYSRIRRCEDCRTYRDNLRHMPDAEPAYPVRRFVLDALVNATRRAKAAAEQAHPNFLTGEITSGEIRELLESLADLTAICALIDLETAERRK